MFTGASNAHVAVLLVDARTGVLRQTRRHARIAALLGVPNLVAVVNKIDLVDFDEARFAQVQEELRALARQVGREDVLAIPVSAKAGDRSEEHTSELQSLMRNSYAVFC